MNNFTFVPHPFLKNPHLMTLCPRFMTRPGLLRDAPIETRLFTVALESQILGYCHWQPDRRKTGLQE